MAMKKIIPLSILLTGLLISTAPLADTPATKASPDPAVPAQDENNILTYTGKPLQNLLDKLPHETADSIVIRFKVKGLVDQVQSFNGLTNTQIGQLTVAVIKPGEEIPDQYISTPSKTDDNQVIQATKANSGDVCIKDLFPSPLNDQQSIDYWQPFVVCIKSPAVAIPSTPVQTPDSTPGSAPKKEESDF